MGEARQAIQVPSESRSQVQIPLESRPATERKGSGGSWGRPESPCPLQLPVDQWNIYTQWRARSFHFSREAEEISIFLWNCLTSKTLTIDGGTIFTNKIDNKVKKQNWGQLIQILKKLWVGQTEHTPRPPCGTQQGLPRIHSGSNFIPVPISPPLLPPGPLTFQGANFSSFYIVGVLVGTSYNKLEKPF